MIWLLYRFYQRLLTALFIRSVIYFDTHFFKKENAIFLSLQEKYEQLKSEYLQSQQELDETLELYSRTEKQLTIEKEINSVQIKELQEKQEKLQNLMQEREDLLIEMESLHLLLLLMQKVDPLFLQPH
mgnify:CR=1 FL=1